MSLKSEFMNVAKERELVYQTSDESGLDELLAGGTATAYIGADPTADSLHIGNLATFSLMRWFQKCGGKPLIVVGGATGRIGDPSGRDSERSMLDEATLASNLRGIRESVALIFGSEVEVADNFEWFKSLGYIDFMRDVGRHFSVNEMIHKDAVKNRLEREQSLSVLEFSYALLQAYDFVELYRRYGVRAQFGGADQWGNMVSGVELARKMGLPQLFVATTPLITDANGVKFGKSMGNAVWLNLAKVSDWDYYQFWRNVDDRDVPRLLRVFTDLEMSEVRRLSALQGAEINEAKKILAFEACRICRGESAALASADTAKATFEKGGIGEDLPTFEMLADTMVILDLVVAAGLADSKSEAKRLLAGGGIYWGESRVSDVAMTVQKPVEKTLLAAGKKKKVVVI